MNKQDLLDELQQAVIDDKVCIELAAQATNLVMGEGNPNADIIFIGEAPGKKEDEVGLPFVGASGKFLNEMLAEAGLVRNDIYITNIVKYRPPNNRDPSPEEKQAFWPYLIKQIEIINPAVVITLGRHSMEYFIPNAKISEQHGHAKEVTYHDKKFLVIPLYHPAAALYNGSLREVLIADFLTAAKVASSVKN